MNPLSFVQKAVLVALGLALALSMTANAALWIQNGRLETKLNTCREEKAEAIGRLTVQNDAVADLKAKSEAARLAARAALLQAEADEKANRSRVQAHQTAIAAPSGGKTCSDALRSIRSGLKP